MAKAKFDAKEFLLRKGEVLAMGISGFFLAVLLIWGATKWGSAQDPTVTANKLKQSSQSVTAAIEGGTPSEADKDQLKLPPWIVIKSDFRTAKVPEFYQTGQLFDPTAQPNTKRENPNVLPIGEYQVDLVRGAMIGLDMIEDSTGETLIAITINKSENKYDADKVKSTIETLKGAAKKGKAAKDKLAQGTPAPKGPPGGVGPAPMGGAPGMSMPGPGDAASGGGSYNPYGMLGGGSFDQNAQRNEKAIKYIPLSELDAAVAKGSLPAFTVIPLRMVTVNAVVPYKRQLEELKRSLRLQTEAEAKSWGPWYDGFEVQRRITRIRVNGTVEVIQDWPDKVTDIKDTSGNYKFEEKYIEVIDTKKIADHLDEGFLPYFTRPEMMLTMPLPLLAKDLGVKYPDVKLKPITDNIDKLKKANKKEVPASELLKQAQGSKANKDIYKPKSASVVSGFGINPNQFGSMGAPDDSATGSTAGASSPGPMAGTGGGKPAGGVPQVPDGYGGTITSVATEVENFLLRFIDCDVKPGLTYEYRIRLKMWNPNYKQDAQVANPVHAKDDFKTLYSPWRDLDARITVPAESFLYAHDVKAYRDQINALYPTGTKDADTKAINNLLQVKENQAVLQVATWMEQVRTDGTKREPVGAWVVAETPVGRGEYIGRKQFVKLPLWSAEAGQYTLREVADKVVKGKGAQPKGWLVDYTNNKSVLVDFEGGRVKSRVNVRFDDKGAMTLGSRDLDEDVATEVLIVRGDGKLVVRSSLADDADPYRRGIVTEWTRWITEIEKRKAGGGAAGDGNPFDNPKPK